jgi:hypothetical protein
MTCGSITKCICSIAFRFDPKFLKIEATIVSIMAYLTLHKKHKVQRIIEASRNTMDGHSPVKEYVSSACV